MRGRNAHRRRLWTALGIIMAVGWLISGCAKAPRVPTPGEAEVGQKITALTDCMARSQQIVETAMRAGASAGEMGPTNSGLADAQEALEDTRKLLQAGKLNEANERVSKALEECQKLETLAAQARDAAVNRQAQARARAQAEQRRQQVMPCIEAARQAVQSARAAGAAPADLAAAQRSLANAEAAVRDAQQLLAQGDAIRALNRLDAAQADCLSARDQATQAGLAAAQRQPTTYAVARGDSLWRISGQAAIYGNPLLWPLIYKANRNKIRDPDVIYPRQVLTIPRQYSPAEARTAAQRARARGRGRGGDGPDYFILDGRRRR